MIRTGAEYLESVRDGRRVLCEGELIDDITTHPKTRGYAQAVAEYYDLHHDPEHQDITTFVDENGERWAKHWFLPRTKEELVERRRYHDFIFRKWARGAMFTRPPASMLPVFYTLYQDPEPWEETSKFHDGRPLAQNIRDKWEYLMRNDLSASPMFLDVQGDRSDPRLRRRDADAAHGRPQRRGDRRARLEGDRHRRRLRQRDLHGRSLEAGRRCGADRLRARARRTTRR